MSKSHQHDINSASSIAAVVWLGTVAVLSFIVQPGLVQGFVVELGYTEAEANDLVFIELAGIAVTAIAMSFLSQLGRWRVLIALALILCAVGNTVSASMAADPMILKMARFFTGTGEGVLVSLTFTAIGLTQKPDRNYAIYLIPLLTYGALVLWQMPLLFSTIGLNGIFFAWAVIALASLAVVKFLPNSADVQIKPSPTAAAIPISMIIIALLAFFVYNIGISTAWANLFRIGVHINPDPQAVADALLLCQFIAIIGAMSALALANRFNRNILLLGGILGSAFSMGLLLMDTHFTTFVLAICLFNFLWNFALPFILSAIVDMEESGKVMPFAIKFQMVGFASGPFMVARILEDGGDYQTIEWVMVGLFLTSAALFLIPLLMHTKILARKQLF